MKMGNPKYRPKRKAQAAPAAKPKKRKSAPSAGERVSPWTDQQHDPIIKESILSFIALLAAIAKCEHDGKPLSEKIRMEMLPRWVENIIHMRITVGLPIDQEEMMKLAVALQNGKIDDSVSGYMRLIGKALLGLQKSAKKIMLYSHDDVAILSAIGVYYRNKSPSSWKNIVRMIEKLGIPELTAEFAPPIKDALAFDMLKDQLRHIVQRLRKDKSSTDYRLTFQEARKLGPTHPKRALYEKYMGLNVELHNMWKDAVRSILRKSGAKSLPIEKINERLDEAGVDVDYFPTGFDGRAGIFENDVKLFTDAEKPIYGKPQPGREITMNRNYDPAADDTNVFEAYDEKTGKKGYFYTYEYHAKAREKKFTIIRSALEDLDGYRKKWEQPLLSWSPSSRVTIDTILSAMAVTIYETQARIGGTGNKSIVKDKDGGESEKNTFGLSTWRVGHIKTLDADKFVVSYSGKKAVRQKHIVKATASPAAKKLVLFLKTLSAGKKPKDFLWAHPLVKRGKPVTASDFNRFLKGFGLPDGFGAHKMRHAKGTTIAKQIIAAKKWKAPVNETNYDNIVRNATAFFRTNIAERVAIALGHKSSSVDADGNKTTKPLWSTSVKSYIDPAVSQQWFLDNGMKPPKWIPAK